MKSLNINSDIICPVCGVPEQNPINEKLICIRAYKVQDNKGRNWHQCLVCSGLYDNAKDLNEDTSMHDTKKGWFTLD